jgi:hypothetical protein
MSGIIVLEQSVGVSTGIGRRRHPNMKLALRCGTPARGLVVSVAQRERNRCGCRASFRDRRVATEAAFLTYHAQQRSNLRMAFSLTGSPFHVQSARFSGLDSLFAADRRHTPVVGQ